MSINIPAETPDESMNPISVEEFERLHPAMLGAIRKAVREEPARTVIGTVGDDRRSHLSSLDLRGIGIEVGRQLSARDMTTEVMGSILEHINQAAAPAHAANTDPSIDSSPNCSARTSEMRDDTDFRRGPGGSPNAARHHTRKGGA